MKKQFRLLITQGNSGKPLTAVRHRENCGGECDRAE